MDKKFYWSNVTAAGVILGLLCMIPTLCNWIFNTTLNAYAVFFYQILAIGSVFFIYGKRVATVGTTENGYSFGQGFQFAILVSLGSGIVAGILSWLLMHVIDPEIATKTISEAMNKFDEMNLSEDARQTAINTSHFMLSFAGMLFMNILSMILTGGIVGLIIAGILQRKPQI